MMSCTSLFEVGGGGVLPVSLRPLRLPVRIIKLENSNNNNNDCNTASGGNNFDAEAALTNGRAD